MNWREVHRLNDDISFGFGFVLNVVLLYLIASIRAKEIVKYNRILFQVCTMDLFFLLLTFIVKPIAVTDLQSQFIVINGFFRFDTSFFCILQFTSWTFFLFMSIMTIPIEFVYRYRVLCCNKDFSVGLQLIALALSAVISIMFCVVLAWAYYVTGSDHAVTAELLADILGDYDGKVRACGSFRVGTAQQYVLLGVAVVTNVAFGIVVWCSVRVYRFLRNQPILASSNRNVDVQKQLNRMMIAQALIPLACLVVPMGTMIVAILMGDNNAVATVVSMMAFSWIPSGNSISVLICVKAYRRKLCRNLTCQRLDRKTSLIITTA